jgi:hypothetical protein
METHMSDQMLEIGDTVRILTPGMFHDQEVKVLNFDERSTTTWYLCDVKWIDGTPRPSWFASSEVRKVTTEKPQFTV